MKTPPTVEVGKLADIAVQNRVYLSVPDEDNKDIQLDVTIMGGDVV
jgi:predicted amidohydrolase YtcJ